MMSLDRARAGIIERQGPPMQVLGRVTSPNIRAKSAGGLRAKFLLTMSMFGGKVMCVVHIEVPNRRLGEGGQSAG